MTTTRARLDKIAAKLPPRPTPTPTPTAFVDDLPAAVAAYLAVLKARHEPALIAARGDTKRAAALLRAEPALLDVLGAIADAARVNRRAATLEECQAALLAGAGRRLAVALGDADKADGSSALAWEALYADSATFGAHTLYSLHGAGLVDHWRRTGGTTDAETLAVAGLGPAEIALLAATG